MKVTSLVFAILLGVFSILCAFFYFTLFYFHLAIFATVSILISYFMFRDYLNHVSNDTKLKPYETR